MQADEFPFITWPAAIQFLTTAVPPPSPAYIGPDDFIEWSYPASIGGTIQLDLRVLLPSGEIKVMNYSQLTISNRNVYSRTIRLPECFLLSAMVSTAQSGYKAGACFTRVILARGTTASYQRAQTLIKGYVAYWQDLTWPGPQMYNSTDGRGRLRKLTGTNPAPGNTIVETVPTGARWRLISLFTGLVTDATVVNRYVYLSLNDGVTTYFFGETPFAQAASQTRYYSWAAGLQRADPAALSFINNPLPADLWLPAGHWIIVGCSGIQLGDDFWAPEMMVEEWLEP